MWFLALFFVIQLQPHKFESIHKRSLEKFWEGIKVTDDSIVFRYFMQGAKKVYIIGDFNNFDTTAGKMKIDKDGAFYKAFGFAPGCYKYKLIVDGRSMLDPTHNHRIHCVWDNFSFFCVTPDRRIYFVLDFLQKIKMCLE